MTRTSLVVLGSTGSIGLQALDVARRHADKIQVSGLAANVDSDSVVSQAREFGVSRVALADAQAAADAASALPDVEVLSGPEGIVELAGSGSDVVLNALVGAAGLRATIRVLDSGSRLALANKESLVAGGELVIGRAKPGQILPVDSEHSALFQCLIGEDAAGARLWLTASGGPFRGLARDRLADVTVDETLAHPTWTMGPKITVDSATLMNKGLEVIEAHHLFGFAYDDIRVVVHPQSTVHSMVEFRDGSVKAHLGVTDMRVPIQYAISHPERWDASAAPADVPTLADLTFSAPDTDAFGCLALAIGAGREGGTMPAVLNAANEVAVEAFLARRCGFLDIERVVAETMQRHEPESLHDLETVETADVWAREMARSLLSGGIV